MKTIENTLQSQKMSEFCWCLHKIRADVLW